MKTSQTGVSEMSNRINNTISIPIIALTALFACASDFAIYEAPATGQLSKITFVNASENHSATLTTFDDGLACTKRRYIHFEDDASIPAGGSRPLTVAGGREFALFATLNKIEEEEYSVELGVTGSGPAPVLSRSFSSIGCTAGLSFPVEPKTDYQVMISGPDPSQSCSVVVSEIGAQGLVVPVTTSERVIQASENKLGSFCEPLE
jgi:hypothetical protein